MYAYQMSHLNPECTDSCTGSAESVISSCHLYMVDPLSVPSQHVPVLSLITLRKQLQRQLNIDVSWISHFDQAHILSAFLSTQSNNP